MKLPIQFGLTSFTGPRSQFTSVFNEFKNKIDLSVQTIGVGDNVILEVRGNELEERGVIPLMYGELKASPEKIEALEIVSDAISAKELNAFKVAHLKK